MTAAGFVLVCMVTTESVFSVGEPSAPMVEKDVSVKNVVVLRYVSMIVSDLAAKNVGVRHFVLMGERVTNAKCVGAHKFVSI